MQEGDENRLRSLSPRLLLPCYTPTPPSSFRQARIRTYKLMDIPRAPTPAHMKKPPLPRNFKAYWSRLPYQAGRPEVREGACMTACCGALYLYGGLSKTVLSDLYVLKADFTSWEPVQVSLLEPEARYGHSMSEGHSQLVIFGGALSANPKTQIRECFNTVRLLEPADKSRAVWTQLPTRGYIVEMRRYHSGSVVGRHLLVVGGMNQKNKVLDDCAVLDLKTGVWRLATFAEGPLAIACHSAVVVLSENSKIAGLEDLLPTSQDQSGIYIFGGVDGRGTCSNKLRLVHVSQQGDLLCTEPLTTGKPPSPRCLHSLVYHPTLRLLLVFGGKETSELSPEIFKDLHILELRTMRWSQVLCTGGNAPRARWAHSAAVLHDSMVIFGGIEASQFSGSETFILALGSDALPALETETRSRSLGRIRVRNRTYLMPKAC